MGHSDLADKENLDRDLALSLCFFWDNGILRQWDIATWRTILVMPDLALSLCLSVPAPFAPLSIHSFQIKKIYVPLRYMSKNYRV